METALHAERGGKIAEVLVKSGDQIDAKVGAASKCILHHPIVELGDLSRKLRRFRRR